MLKAMKGPWKFHGWGLVFKEYKLHKHIFNEHFAIQGQDQPSLWVKRWFTYQAIFISLLEPWYTQMIEKSLFSSGYLRFFIETKYYAEVNRVELFLSEICNGLGRLVCGCLVHITWTKATLFIVCRILIKLHYTRRGWFAIKGGKPSLPCEKAAMNCWGHPSRSAVLESATTVGTDLRIYYSSPSSNTIIEQSLSIHSLEVRPCTL